MSDLTLTPDFPIEETIKYKTIVSPFENGAEQRRAKWNDPLRQFRLSYISRPIADWTTIATFYNTKKGPYTAFTWTNPNDSTEYTVRFVEDSLVITRKAYAVIDFEFSLIQVKT